MTLDTASKNLKVLPKQRTVHQGRIVLSQAFRTTAVSTSEITELERQIASLSKRLADLRKQVPPKEIPPYRFETIDGDVSLAGLFAGKRHLLAIHNMGQGCRFCTLWADGFNGVLPHLESAMAVVLLSRDPPAIQRDFANSRNWRFRLASHGGNRYIHEQSVMEGGDNMPGAVLYERSEEQVFRRNSVTFGPGDTFSPVWHLLALAGIGEDDWTPQFRYWMPPATLDDGENARLE